MTTTTAADKVVAVSPLERRPSHSLPLPLSLMWRSILLVRSLVEGDCPAPSRFSRHSTSSVSSTRECRREPVPLRLLHVTHRHSRSPANSPPAHPPLAPLPLYKGCGPSHGDWQNDKQWKGPHSPASFQWHWYSL